MNVLLLIVSLSIVGAWSASSSAIPAESAKFGVLSEKEFNMLKAYFHSDKNATFLTKEQTAGASNCWDLGSYGGTGGGKFSDPCVQTRSITRIVVETGSYDDVTNLVRRIRTTYSNGVTYTHGILEGSPHTVNIRSQEELAGFLVRAGVFIDQLTIFVRYDGGEYRTYGPYGGFGGAPHLIFADKISAIHGSAGDILDRFGCRGRF